MPTQAEYNVTKQQQRELYVKINLLNFKFQIVDELSGVLLSDSFTISATSDIRRTANITITPTDSSFDVGFGNKIWLDKYVQVYRGIKDVHTDEIVYTNMGIYLINNPSKTYNATENVISLELTDLMCKLTGMRNGNIEGMTYIIPQGSNIRSAIIATLAQGGFTKYVVENVVQTVPSDIKIESGGTLYQILTELNNILPSYEMYFDVDGVFHYDKIPSGYNEQVIIDDDLWKYVLIDYNINTPFDGVKNVIEVWGKCHDISNYGGTATVSGDTYQITCANVDTLRDNLKIGFTTTSSVANPRLQVNSIQSYPIKNEDGTNPTFSSSTQYYVVKWIASGFYFLFMGEVQPHYTIEETNPSSPFYVGGTLGRIRMVLQGGEYDNIYTDDLARQRAVFELYTNCRLPNSVTINCVPIYWIDVNILIEITLPNKQGVEVTSQYIVKEVSTSGGIDGTQTITLMQYYPLYPSPTV